MAAVAMKYDRLILAHLLQKLTSFPRDFQVTRAGLRVRVRLPPPGCGTCGESPTAAAAPS